MRRYLLYTLVIVGATASPGLAMAGSTPWQTHMRAHAMNGTTLAFAGTTARHGAMLAFYCVKGGDAAVVVQVRHIDFRPGTTRTVSWRVDEDAPVEQDWYNRSKSGAGLAGEPAIQLVKQIAAAKQRVVVRSAGTTVAFSTSGALGAIRKVLSACGLVN
jgi:hypothetical protein